MTGPSCKNMTDTDIENVYKLSLPVSHYAGLRAVYDAGFLAGASLSVTSLTQDMSLTQTAPSTDVTIQTP